MRTTNIIVSRDIDFSKLEGKFQLLQYRLSKRQEEYKKNVDKNFFYSRLTNSYKETFDVPFYYFTNDRPQSALYSLVPKNQTAPKWEFDFGGLEEINATPLAFNSVPLHVLLKVLMASYFYNEFEMEKRVCQSRFYAVGKKEGKIISAIDIELKHEFLLDKEVESEFYIKNPATLFVEHEVSQINDSYLHSDTYYELIQKESLTYLRQIRPSKVKDHHGLLYREVDSRLREKWNLSPAQLHWHSDKNPMLGKAYILYKFQEKYLNYLKKWDINAKVKEIPFRKYKPSISRTHLPLEDLSPIYLFDNRLNKDSVDIKYYVDLFANTDFIIQRGTIKKHSFRLNFELLNESEFISHKPLLLLQDCDKEDFEQESTRKDGLLKKLGFADPKKEIYKKHPDVPKQTLNLNPNSSSDFNNSSDYLTYEPIQAFQPLKQKEYWDLEKDSRDKYDNWKALMLKLDICLNELFLKDILVNDKKIRNGNNDYTLPCLDQYPQLLTYAYITGKIIMFFEDDRIQFADLQTPEGREKLMNFGCHWSEIKELFGNRLGTDNEEKIDHKISTAHFVVGSDLILEIEKLDESILPNISLIEERKRNDQKLSVRSQEAIGTYQGGIWHNTKENAYVVGGLFGMQQKQSNAHHVYKLHFYSGEVKFDISMLLETMAVQFVRKNQYTVYPYFFDLIRLYREVIQERLSSPLF